MQFCEKETRTKIKVCTCVENSLSGRFKLKKSSVNNGDVLCI